MYNVQIMYKVTNRSDNWSSRVPSSKESREMMLSMHRSRRHDIACPGVDKKALESRSKEKLLFAVSCPGAYKRRACVYPVMSSQGGIKESSLLR